MPAKKTRTINKSAKTGRIVSAKYAKTHPATTFKERVTPKKRSR